MPLTSATHNLAIFAKYPLLTEILLDQPADNKATMHAIKII